MVVAFVDKCVFNIVAMFKGVMVQFALQWFPLTFPPPSATILPRSLGFSDNAMKTLKQDFKYFKQLSIQHSATLRFPTNPTLGQEVCEDSSYYMNVSSTLVVVLPSPTLPAFLWSGRSVWRCQPWPWQQALMSLQPSVAFPLSFQQSPSYPKRTKYNMHKLCKCTHVLHFRPTCTFKYSDIWEKCSVSPSGVARAHAVLRT